MIKYWKTILKIRDPKLPHLETKEVHIIWKHQPPTKGMVAAKVEKERQEEENEGKEIQVFLESVPIELSGSESSIENGVAIE